MSAKTVKVHKQATEPSKDKSPYQPPHLQEHGNAKNITLQTFFGTFSPPSSD